MSLFFEKKCGMIILALPNRIMNVRNRAIKIKYWIKWKLEGARSWAFFFCKK